MRLTSDPHYEGGRKCVTGGRDFAHDPNIPRTSLNSKSDPGLPLSPLVQCSVSEQTEN